MKEKTKRKIQKLFVKFQILTSIFTIVPILTTLLILPIVRAPINAYFGLATDSKTPDIIIGLLTILVIIPVIYEILLKFYSIASTPNDRLFKKIDFQKKLFCKPSEKIIQDAVDGILNLEKARDFFVHAAPISDEEKRVFRGLNKLGFAEIIGGPGEGKSMLAYNSMFRYRKIYLKYIKKKYSNYILNVELLENKRSDLISDILKELDGLKSRKLILIDDAHKLSFDNILKNKLTKEALQGNGKFIWVSTNYYQDEPSIKEVSNKIEIDFKLFCNKLVTDLYQSQNPSIKKALEGKAPRLQHAIERASQGFTKDTWTFNFIATKGEDKLAEEIYALNSFKRLIIFLFSAYSVLSDEGELTINRFITILDKIEIGWVKDKTKKVNFEEVIIGLSEQTRGRKPFLRIRNKSTSDRGYLEAFHYSFSRAVIRILINNNTNISEVKDLLSASKVLLTDNFYNCRHFVFFLDELSLYSEEYIRNHLAWLTKFLNEPITENLFYYQQLIKRIKLKARDLIDEIFKKDFHPMLSSKLSEAKVSQFYHLSRFLNLLDEQKTNVLEHLDYRRLANEANKADISQFHLLGYLLRALNDRKEDFIEHLDYRRLANEANKVDVFQFHLLDHFLRALDDRKADFMEHLNYDRLLTEVGKADVSRFHILIGFLKTLDDRKADFLEHLDYERLANEANKADVSQFSQLVGLLRFLDDRKADLMKHLDYERLANEANKVDVSQLLSVVYFFRALDDHKVEFMEHLDYDKLLNEVDKADVSQRSKLYNLSSTLKGFRELENWRKTVLGNKSLKEEGEVKLGTRNIHDSCFYETAKLQNDPNLSVFDNIATELSKANISQFDQLSIFLSKLEDSKENVLESKYLDYDKLATETSKANMTQFDQLSNLLNALESWKGNILLNKNLDYDKLATEASKANMTQFDQLSNLLNALEGWKGNILLNKNLDYDRLTIEIKKINTSQFEQVLELLYTLEDWETELRKSKNLNRNKIKALTDKANALQFGELIDFLHAFQDRITELCNILIRSGN